MAKSLTPASGEAAAKAAEDAAAKKDDASKAKAGGRKDAITVTASANRRRAGIAFAKGAPVTLAIADLPKGALEALKADPVLAVSEN